MINIMKSINEAFALLPSKMDSKEARLMLLVIGLQESRFRHRRQLVGNPPRPTGPAKSFWQGEKGGGMVHGVRTHSGVKTYAHDLYKARGVEPTNQAIWDAIEHDESRDYRIRRREGETMKSIDQIMREALELIRETHGLAVTSVSCYWVGTLSNPNKTISRINLEGSSCTPNKDKEDR